MLGKDLLGLRYTEKEDILNIINTARYMKDIIEKKEGRKDLLKNTRIVTVFYENSTRTKMSFSLASKYLGATISDLSVATSSVNKGESLIDTGVTLDQMGTDIIIMRHSMTGSAHILSKNVKSSIINAGDGINEHPTQALLDLFTIIQNKGNVENLKIAIVGDISHSRVARSNVFALNKLGAKVVLAGPSTLASKSMETLGVEVTNNVEYALTDADVVMGLRVQLERQKGTNLPDLREYSDIFGINKDNIHLAKKDALIMHPGPVNRGVELSSDIIDSPNSLINEQVKNGVAIRMSILYLLTKEKGENYDNIA